MRRAMQGARVGALCLLICGAMACVSAGKLEQMLDAAAFEEALPSLKNSKMTFQENLAHLQAKKRGRRSMGYECTGTSQDNVEIGYRCWTWEPLDEENTYSGECRTEQPGSNLHHIRYDSAAIRSGYLAQEGHEDPIRDLFIYVPEEYDSNSSKTYPVVTYLHGFGWKPAYTATAMQHLFDHLIAVGHMDPMIVAMPDGSTATGGSFYIDSILTGNFREFVTTEVFDYVHDNYNTKGRDPNHNILAGFSMGGAGALTSGWHNKDKYGAIISGNPAITVEGAIEFFTLGMEQEHPGAGPHYLFPDSCAGKFLTNVHFSLSAALSPNLTSPNAWEHFDNNAEFLAMDPAEQTRIKDIYRCDLPRRPDGTYDMEIVAMQEAGSPLQAFLDTWDPSTPQSQELLLDVALFDSQGVYYGNKILRNRFDEVSYRYEYVEYTGQHSNRFMERLTMYYGWASRFFRHEVESMDSIEQYGGEPLNCTADMVIDPTCLTDAEFYPDWQKCYHAARRELHRTEFPNPYVHRPSKWEPSADRIYKYKQDMLLCCEQFSSELCKDRCTLCSNQLEPVCGEMVPQPFNTTKYELHIDEKVCGELSELSKKALIALLVVLMYGMGCTMELSSVRKHMMAPKGIIIGWVSQFLFMPAIAYALAKIFNLPNEQAIGAMIVGSSPGGTTSNLFALLAKADVSLSISMTVFSSIGATFMMPLLLWGYGKEFTDSTIQIPFGEIVAQLMIVVMPTILGLFVRAWNKRIAEISVKVGSAVGILIIFAAIISGAIQNKDLFATLDANFYVSAVLIGLIGASFGGLMTYFCDFLGRVTGKWSPLTPAEKRAVVLETAIQNGALAIGLATISFTPQVACKVSTFPMFYSVFIVIESIFLTIAMRTWWKKKEYPLEKEGKSLEERLPEVKLSPKRIVCIASWTFCALFAVCGVIFFFAYRSQAEKVVASNVLPTDPTHAEFKKFIGDFSAEEDKDYDVQRLKSYYLFHLTNPEAYLNGAKPVFEEKGPFTYVSSRKRVDVCFPREDAVRYKEQQSFEYANVAGEEDPTTTLITSFNAGYLKLLETVGGEQLLTLGLGSGPTFQTVETCMTDTMGCYGLTGSPDLTHALWAGGNALFKTGFEETLSWSLVQGYVSALHDGLTQVLPDTVISMSLPTVFSMTKEGLEVTLASGAADLAIPQTFQAFEAGIPDIADLIMVGAVPQVFDGLIAATIAAIPGLDRNIIVNDFCVNGGIDYSLLGGGTISPEFSIVVGDLSAGTCTAYDNALSSSDACVSAVKLVQAVMAGADPSLYTAEISALGFGSIADISLFVQYLTTSLIPNFVEPNVLPTYQALDPTIVDVKDIGYFHFGTGLGLTGGASVMSVADMDPVTFPAPIEIGVFAKREHRFPDTEFFMSANVTKDLFTIMTDVDKLIEYGGAMTALAAGDFDNAPFVISGLGMNPAMSSIMGAYISFIKDAYTIPAVVANFNMVDPGVLELSDVGYLQWATMAPLSFQPLTTVSDLFQVPPEWQYWLTNEGGIAAGGIAVDVVTAKEMFAVFTDATKFQTLAAAAQMAAAGDVTGAASLGATVTTLSLQYWQGMIAYAMDYFLPQIVRPGVLEQFKSVDATVQTFEDIGYLQFASGAVVGASAGVPSASLHDLDPATYAIEPEFSVWAARHHTFVTHMTAADAKALLVYLSDAEKFNNVTGALTDAALKAEVIVEMNISEEFFDAMIDWLPTAMIAMFAVDDPTITTRQHLGWYQWVTGIPVAAAVPGATQLSVMAVTTDYQVEPEWFAVSAKPMTADQAMTLWAALADLAQFFVFRLNLGQALAGDANAAATIQSLFGLDETYLADLHTYLEHCRDGVLFPTFQAAAVAAGVTDVYEWKDLGYLQWSTGIPVGMASGLPMDSMSTSAPEAFPVSPELALYSKMVENGDASYVFTRSVKAAKLFFAWAKDTTLVVQFLQGALSAQTYVQLAQAAAGTGNLTLAGIYAEKAQMSGASILSYGTPINDYALIAGYIQTTVLGLAKGTVEAQLCPPAYCSAANGYFHSSGFISTRTAQEWIIGWSDPVIAGALPPRDRRSFVKQAEFYPGNHQSALQAIRQGMHDEMNTGMKDSSKTGNLETWQGTTALPSEDQVKAMVRAPEYYQNSWQFSGWKEEVPIQGGQGAYFPPVNQIESRDNKIWITSYMRPADLTYTEDKDLHGINTKKYIIGDQVLKGWNGEFFNSATGEDSGVMYLSPRGFPVCSTLPYYGRANNEFTWGTATPVFTELPGGKRHVSSPNMEITYTPGDYETFLQIEPISGKTMKFSFIGQASVIVPSPKQDLLNQATFGSSTVEPMYWTHDSSSATKEIADIATGKLYLVYGLPKNLLIAFEVMAGVCLIMGIVFTVLTKGTPGVQVVPLSDEDTINGGAASHGSTTKVEEFEVEMEESSA